MNVKSCFCILLAGSAWGFLGFFVRNMTDLGMDQMQIIFLKMLFGIIVLGIFIALKDPSLFRFCWKDAWFLAASGLICFLCFNFFYYKAMEYTTLAVAAALLYIAPAFSLFFSALLFKEKVTKRKIFSILVIFFGCSFVGGLLGREAYISLIGFFLCVIAALSYGLYGIFGRIASNRSYHPYTTSFYNMIFCLLGTLFFVDLPEIAESVSLPLLGYGFGIGVPCGAIAYVLFTFGVKSVDPGVAMVLGTAEPIVGSLISAFIFDEPMTPRIIIGIILIVCGISLMGYEQRRISLQELHNI